MVHSRQPEVPAKEASKGDGRGAASFEAGLRRAPHDDGATSLHQTFRKTPRLFGRGLISLYRYTLASLVGFRCRHLPSCSEYADQALQRFGLWAGSWMTIARLLRCQPWGTSGLDFVPETLPEKSRWYLPWRYAKWRGTNAEPLSASSFAEMDSARR